MKANFQIRFIFLLTLLITACSPQAEQTPAATPTAIPIPTVLPTPSSVVPLEERLLAAIDVAFPDEMVFVQGYLWAKTDAGYVVQIDPATNSVVGEIKVDTTTNSHDYCQGLGTDGENVWACSTRGDDNFKTIDVVRIDPGTQSVVATVEVGKIFDQYNMPFLHNHIWVLTGDGSSLVGINTTTNQPTQPIDLGTRCFQVAAATESLLVTCKQDNIILRVAPETMQVTQRVTVSPAPWNIRASDSGVWVSLGNALLRLDPVTLNPVVRFDKMPGDKDLFVTQESVWVRTDYGFLFRIDSMSNLIAEQYWPDQRFYNMGGFLVTSDSVWTSAGDDDLVLHINLK